MGNITDWHPGQGRMSAGAAFDARAFFELHYDQYLANRRGGGDPSLHALSSSLQGIKFSLAGNSAR